MEATVAKHRVCNKTNLETNIRKRGQEKLKGNNAWKWSRFKEEKTNSQV